MRGRVKRRRGRLLPLLITAVVFIAPQLQALDPGRDIDRYQFDTWRIADGLPSDTITGIVQTPDGYLWIGTTKGLVRFDGVRFENLGGKGDLEPGRHITALYVDKGGVLWVGSLGGLSRYDGGGFENFPVVEDRQGPHVTSIAGDIKGNLWVGTETDYLFRLGDGTVTPFDADKGLKGGEKIDSIFEDSSGVLWVAAAQGGLFKYTGGKFFKVKIEGVGDQFTVNAVYEDSDGFKWRGTNRGLIKIKGKQTRLYTTFIRRLSNNDVKVVLEDGDKNLWAGTADGVNRIVKLPGNDVIISQCLSGMVVTCLFEDRESNLWVGTNGSGLKRVRDGVFTTYSVNDGLPNNYIHSLCEDRSGEIWIGSGYGLSRFHNGTFDQFLIRWDFPKKALFADSNDNLWVGTEGSGLFRIKNEESSPFGQTLLSENIQALFMDKKGILWVGTDRGVNFYSQNRLESRTQNDGLPGESVFSFMEDKRGDLWVGTSGGLLVIRGGVWEENKLDARLPGIPVSCVYEDEDAQETYWIGTFGSGLRRLRKGKIIAFTQEDGLCSDNIYQVLEDDRDKFWMSSDSGVLQVNKINLNDFAGKHTDTIDCVPFGLSDGMRSIECSRSGMHSAVKTSFGRLWFATKEGIAVLDPSSIRINKTPPEVKIEKIFFDTEELDRRDLQGGNIVRKGINDVVINFTATTFVSPEKVKFKYRLSGFDRNWRFSASGTDRTARYPNLPPGKYTFRVIASNSDGVWNSTGDTLAFTIRKVFFKTNIFRFLVFLLLAGSGLGVYYLYRKNFFHPQEKYKGSTLAPDRAEEYLKKLVYLLEIEKVYLDENISLQALSEKIGISSHHLSQVINEKLDKNFIGLINSYRVEEAKKRLIDPKNQHISILGVAFEVGFNSKAAFNRAFKKYTQVTPSEYKKKHISE